jgi:hypothetical protein
VTVNLEDLSISELFKYLEEMGVNCSQLRKAQCIMKSENVRQCLYQLLENHIKHKAYKDAMR